MEMEYCLLAPPLSDEAYARCFREFRRDCKEWRAMLGWTQNRLLRDLSAKEKLAVLSVGSGNGDFDFRFIKILLEKIKALEYVMVEPNDVHCRLLRKRFVGEAFPQVNFEIDPMPFEEFAIARPFDLVLFTHCLYYIPDRQQAILHALEAIKDEGLVLIFHQTPLGIHQVQQEFLKRVKGYDGEMFNSQDLQDLLDRLEIPYRLEVLDSFLDVTDCFHTDSQRGANLLCFFLESDVLQLNPRVRGEIMDYIKALTIDDNGRLLLRQPVAIFSLIPNGRR
jgi:SAM-dependent methyltransferase